MFCRSTRRISTALLVSGAALALQANQSADVEELSLKSLFDLEVTVAAKSKERLVTTSGTVYVFTQEEFRQYGWRTVVDALSAVPGVNISNTYRYSDGGHRGWGTTKTQDMSETIVLLNGREITVARNGRAGQVLQGMPLNNVKRIEVLQGPQSTLYGSHALQGVVNIITETNEAKFDDMGATLAYQRGDVQTEQSDFKAHVGKDEAYIGVAGQLFYTDRDWEDHKEFYSNPANTQTENGGPVEKLWVSENLHNQNPDDYNNHEEAYSLQGYTEFKGFYAGYFDYRLKNLHTPGIMYTGHMTGDFQERNTYFGYKNNTLVENLDFFSEVERVWQRDMYLNFKPHMSIPYLRDTASWITDPIDLGDTLLDSINIEHFYLGEVQRWDTRIWKVRAQANYTLNHGDVVKQDFVAGLEYANSDYFVAYGVNTLYSWQESDEMNWPNTQTNRFTFYLQDQVSILDEMFKVTAGFRVNKESHNNLNITPRVSVGIEPIKNTVLKFNYTEGFRSLAFDQFAQATKSTDPTTMRQFEGGFAQRLTLGAFDALGSLTWYNMRKTGAYTRDMKAVGVQFIPDTAKVDISGLEGQLKFSLSNIPKNQISGFVGANYVLRDPELASDGKTEYHKEDPRYTAKIGLSDRVFDMFDVGLFVNVMSPLEYEVMTYRDTVLYGSDGKVIPKTKSIKTQDAVGVLNLTLGVGPYKLFDAIDARINVQVNNLLDEQYVHAVRRWWPAEGFLQPPRTFSVKAEFSL
jgi:outer membrane receptor protein involved in Fe transport